MAKKTVVVIGSNCFTGSHIVDGLLADPRNTVFGVSRRREPKDLYLPYRRRESARFRFQQIDIVKQTSELLRLLDEVKPVIVVNAAALSEIDLSHERPIEYFETNTLALVRIADHLRKSSYLKRFVHISSADVFGNCAAPVPEDGPFNPSTPHAVSRAAADMYFNTLIANRRFPATLIRFTNDFGKHQQPYRLIPRTIIYLKLGRPIELHGGGKAAKSFIHIRDVVTGILAAVEHGGPGAYHFSDPSDRTVAEVVHGICLRLGRDFEESVRVVEERLGQDARYWLDCSRANRELSWAPRVPFMKGIDEVIQWIEENWSEFQKEPLVYEDV